MLGVTISLGEKYDLYAKRSAEQLKKHTGLDSVILGQKELDKVKGSFAGKLSNNKELACYLKYYVFDIIPEAEDILYYDCDWSCIGDWNPEQYSGTEEFVCVKDRVWHFQDDPALWKKIKTFCDPWSYFNAGFYIHNRKHHRNVLDEGKIAYFQIERKWFDQCSTNYVIHKLGIPVYFLDRRFNWMNFGKIADQFDIRAVHNSGNYSLYERGEVYKSECKIKFSEEQMCNLAGYYKLHQGDKVRLAHLYYDGTTDREFLWCADKDGNLYFYDYFSEKFYPFDKIVNIG